MIIWVGKDINKNYAWEFSALYKYRNFNEGIDFIDLNIKFDKYKDDHKPSFDIQLVILNFKIFEFNIYYKHHRD